MAPTQSLNKTLEEMAPTSYGELHVIGAAPRIGAEPRPADDTRSRSLDGNAAEPIDGVEGEITFAEGARRRAPSITWTCRADRGNLLHFDGRPFVARYLAWSISNISWQAGLGWPVFTTVCPASDYDYRFKFPDIPRFQIVPVFGGFSWKGCASSASATGNSSTPVEVWVNDFPDAYGDNAGTFDFTVTGWA